MDQGRRSLVVALWPALAALPLLAVAPLAGQTPRVVIVQTNAAGDNVHLIDPSTNKVVQQFYGEGGDAIRVGHGSVWLSNLRQANVWRLDPKRITATLAEY